MEKILIVGATSAMAISYARLKAADGAEFFLVARNKTKLSETAGDLRSRGAGRVCEFILDVDNIDKHSEMFEVMESSIGLPSIALIAHGTLPKQDLLQSDTTYCISEFHTNAVSTIAIINEIAIRFENQRAGVLVVITSVAGDRGRPSNYLYGAAKSAVSTYLEGLSSRMFKIGVAVIDVRPGFVDSPMTKDLDLPKALVVQPETIGVCIQKAIKKRKSLIYAPWYWRFILLVIRSIPSFIFRRVNL